MSDNLFELNIDGKDTEDLRTYTLMRRQTMAAE